MLDAEDRLQVGILPERTKLRGIPRLVGVDRPRIVRMGKVMQSEHLVVPHGGDRAFIAKPAHWSYLGFGVSAIELLKRKFFSYVT